MAMVIAQVSGRCVRMLVHGLCLHVSKPWLQKFSPVHDLQQKNEVYLHCLAEASSVNKIHLLVCSWKMELLQTDGD